MTIEIPNNRISTNIPGGKEKEIAKINESIKYLENKPMLSLPEEKELAKLKERLKALDNQPTPTNFDKNESIFSRGKEIKQMLETNTDNSKFFNKLKDGLKNISEKK